MRCGLQTDATVPRCALNNTMTVFFYPGLKQRRRRVGRDMLLHLFVQFWNTYPKQTIKGYIPMFAKIIFLPLKFIIVVVFSGFWNTLSIWMAQSIKTAVHSVMNCKIACTDDGAGDLYLICIFLLSRKWLPDNRLCPCPL